MKYIVVVIAGVLLAGCGSGQQATPQQVQGANAPFDFAQGAEFGGPSTPLALRASLRMTNASRASAQDDRKSWMLARAKSAKELLYVGDWATNDVYVYDYTSQKAVGTLTGFNEPYGMCVDAKGDMYISNFGSGTILEYAHGGTAPIKTFTTNGYAIGCSLDAAGDLAATNFYTPSGEGDICIWKGGSGSPTCYSTSSCASGEYLWTAGYDDRGDLYVGGDSSGTLCELPHNKSKFRTVQIEYGSQKFSIDFPGGIIWDGKYLALGDQEMGGGYETGVYQAEVLHSGNLKIVGKTELSDNCYSDYTDDMNPFIVGKKNTPVNHVQGTEFVGPNLWCYDAGSPRVDYWKYPAGGMPYTYLANPPGEPYGAAVSIAE